MKRNAEKSVGKRIIAGLRDLADALKANEHIADKFNCRTVTLDITPTSYRPKAVKATRRLLRSSQAVFAQFLGVKAATVRSWEQGRQSPSDMARRFMDEIRRNPEYWRQRLRECAVIKETG